MKYLLLILVAILLAITVGCSEDSDHAAVAYPDLNPDAGYKPIINLYSTARTPFKRISYDVSGEVVLLTDTLYLLQSPVVLDLDTVVDSQLIEYDRFGSFRWETDTTAMLIAFRQPKKDIRDGGMMICGDITPSDTSYLSEPILWLPFPGVVGTVSDTLSSDPLDVNTVHEVNSPMLDQLGYTSYVYGYRRNRGSREIFSWYTINGTLLAILEYQNGVRVRSLHQI